MVDFDELFKQIVYIQISSGSVSMIGSSMIAIMVYRKWGTSSSRHGKSYRRIIFGLSVSDIMQSFSLVVGPWAYPRGIYLPLWGLGNQVTCQINGTLLSIGLSAVPMYTFGLCLYHLCKIKLRMSEHEFAQKIEPVIHCTILALILTIHVAALGTDIINPSPLGTLCYIAAHPTGCRSNSELFGECEGNSDVIAVILGITASVVMPFLCLVGIIVCMGMLFWHTVSREIMFGNTSPNNEEVMSGTIARSFRLRRSLHAREQAQLHLDDSVDDDDCPDSNILEQDLSLPLQSSSQPQDVSTTPRHSNCLRASHISKLYKRELMIQATLYFFVFGVTFIPYITMAFFIYFNKQPPQEILKITAALYPLGGFLNILVYTRPKVSRYRRLHPNCSRLRALWQVIKAGGEMPHPVQSSRNWCCNLLDQCFNVKREENGHLRPISNLVVNPQSQLSSLPFGVASPTSLLPDSAMSINGLSESINSDDPAYRSNVHWDHIQGSDGMNLQVIEEEESVCEVCDEVRSRQNLSSCIDNITNVSHRDTFEVPGQADHVVQDMDDMWAHTFKRVRRHRYSE